MGFGGEVPAEEAEVIQDVLLAERMHWTLDEVRALDVVDRAQVLTVLEASDRAKAFRGRRRGGK